MLVLVNLVTIWIPFIVGIVSLIKGDIWVGIFGLAFGAFFVWAFYGSHKHAPVIKRPDPPRIARRKQVESALDIESILQERPSNMGVPRRQTDADRGDKHYLWLVESVIGQIQRRRH